MPQCDGRWNRGANRTFSPSAAGSAGLVSMSRVHWTLCRSHLDQRLVGGSDRTAASMVQASATAPTESSTAFVVVTDIPARLDRLPWGRFHTLVVIALGITW